MKLPPPPTILVVEDSADIRRTVAAMLSVNGYHCVTAASGMEGLALAQRERPMLVITDINMPGMSGYELLQEFANHEALRAIPVIAITATADRAAARQGMDLGAADFISKPFTESELIRSVHARLEKKELVDELDAFAHTVAHDLKNPLATLLGRLGLLEMTLGKADESTLRRHLGEANIAAARLNSIIDELLLLAGVRRVKVNLEPLAMGSLVADAVDRLEDLIRRSQATVETGETWPAVLGHGPWVTHVWTNFISNAAKYAGPAAHITLGCDLMPGGRTARFWVQDRGPGLDPAAQSALFIPFPRISRIRAKGHGLGLSIVRRIIDKLGGTVGVESSPGTGARFWFELPVVPVPVAP